ncbi:MAG: amine oxidase [Methylovulum sp.]|uniref:amine oxidase n=1 Tax=Methylovulum sp. TaxID=1916980 RepID=UPI002638E908|nr:amine oxidase [Methylovulum sp.]MDD2723361.1 amine oxidase [Methylovulum sp.]MDD5124272.1 amine oxidase [Methylovulum sp.]
MMNEQINADSIAQFHDFIAGQKPQLQNLYGQLLAQDLSRQQWDGCFQRNVLVVLERAYDDALAYLKSLTLDGALSGVNRGLSDLTKALLTAFDGFVDEFLLFVVDKHRTSCALSNFPDEHKPDQAYVNEVRRSIAGLWQDFALDVNAYVLECR